MKNKRWIAAALGAALACALALPAGAASPKVDPSTCVNDYAGILSQDTEEYVENLTAQLQQSCGAQIGVYTVDNIGNTDLEQYAYEVFNAWGLGDAREDNGVLLLMTPGDDDYIALQGEGLEITLNSATLGDLLYDNLEPYWPQNGSAGDFDAGTRQTVRALAEKLADIYDVSIDLSGAPGGAVVGGNPRQGGGSILPILVLVLVLVIVLVVIARPRGPRFGGPRVIFAPWPRRRRPPRPPRPPRRGPRWPGGPGDFGPGGFGPGGPGFGGPGYGGHRPPSPPRSGPRPSGGGFRSGGGSSRPFGGASRGGGGFRAGGGSTRGGGASRRR